MTKNITDRELRQAAASVRDSLLKSVEEMEAPEHSFSAESETAMLRVAADIPKRQVRKASHIILRKAACVALVFLIGTGSLLTFNEDARAAVYSWIRIIRENEKRIDYLYNFEDISMLNSEIALDYVPEDFIEKKVFKNNASIVLLFEDTRYDKGFVINLVDLSSIDILSLHDYQDNLEEVLINGIKGDFYPSSKESDTKTLIWIIEEKNIAVSINGNLPKDEIVKIAEGIIIK